MSKGFLRLINFREMSRSLGKHPAQITEKRIPKGLTKEFQELEGLIKNWLDKIINKQK